MEKPETPKKRKFCATHYDTAACLANMNRTDIEKVQDCIEWLMTENIQDIRDAMKGLMAANTCEHTAMKHEIRALQKNPSLWS